MRACPKSASCRNRRRGLVPFSRTSGPGRKWMRHAVTGPSVNSRSCPRISVARAGSLLPLPADASSIVLIWSPAASARLIRLVDTASSPFRSRSNAASRLCATPAMSSKPNIAPDPFMVCSARKARPTTSWSSRFSSSSSSADSSSTSSSRASSWKACRYLSIIPVPFSLRPESAAC